MCFEGCTIYMYMDFSCDRQIRGPLRGACVCVVTCALHLFVMTTGRIAWIFSIFLDEFPSNNNVFEPVLVRTPQITSSIKHP